MKKLFVLILILLLIPTSIFSQEMNDFTTVQTAVANVKIPGNWTMIKTEDISGQTFLKNKEGVIIAIAQNPKKNYSFFKDENSDFENVWEFYKWDSDYRAEIGAKVSKIKENSELKYVIWKYKENKLDNIFLFGSTKENFLNLLLYTNLWSESVQVKFLENLYKINK